MNPRHKLNVTQITGNSVQNFKISEIIERGKIVNNRLQNNPLIMNADIISVLDLVDVQLGVILKPGVFWYVVTDLSAGGPCLTSSVNM
jgi:hypothetical protein